MYAEGRRVELVTGKDAASVVCLLFLFSGCSSENLGPNQGSAPRAQRRNFAGAGQEGGTAVSVKAHRVGRRSISNFIVANTTLEAVRDVSIYSKLSAIVSALEVEEGDSVSEGQLLARLEEKEIRNEFNQAEIAVQQAQVALEQAEIRAKLSAASYERAQSLFEQNLTSRQEFDQAVLNNQTDALALENGRRQLEAARARLEAIRIQLEYTRVVSPIPGVVTERLVDVGDRVNVNELMFNVQEFPPLWARIYIPERALPQLRVGQPSQLVFEAFPERRFQGTIKMLSPTVDAASGTVKVTLEIDGSGRLLRPGMFGTAYIPTQTRPEVVAVPKKAILRERDQSFVFLIQPDQSVVKQEVQLGLAEEHWVEITQGVEPGDALVTVGYETLNDGYLVRVADWEDTREPIPGMESAPVRAAAPEPGSPPPAPVRREEPSPAREGAPSRAAAPSREGPPAAGADRAGRGQMFARLLENPEIRRQYEARRAADPELATDPQKRRAFIREMISRYGGGRTP